MPEIGLGETNTILYILKIFVINIGTYLTNAKILGTDIKLKVYKQIIVYVTLMIIAIISGIVRIITNFNTSIIVTLFLLALMFAIVTRNKLGYSILVNSISISINYIIYFIVTIIGFLIYNITQKQNECLNFFIITILYFISIKVSLKMRRIRKGIIFLKDNINNEYLNLLVLNMSVIILFIIIILTNYKEDTTLSLIFVLIVISSITIVTIQKSLQLYYKQKMLVKDLEETKKELEDKNKEVAELEKENLEFSKVSHSIKHRQKSLEHKLEELSKNSEIADEIDLKDRIENLSADLSKKQIVVLDKTGITKIDDMLGYMQSECVKNKIDFQLQLSGNIYTMINHYVSKEELEILLADHIKNAIIAIGYGDNVNKSILVRLGKLDGGYGFYIYDSGIEFEIKTLLNLGKKPSTTHKDSGGTGMGFMNTFDTLRKHKASFVIEEYGKPVRDNFTKALKFKFDGKNEFKIYSYRDEEIKKLDKVNSLVVEKL